MKRVLSRYLVVIVLVAICLVLVFVSPRFFELSNLENLGRRVSAGAVAAVGETLVIVTAGIDLSVGSVAALGGVIATGSIKHFGCPVLLGIALGMLVGLACGLINGVLVAKGRIPPFIVTLGMMLAARGTVHLLTQGSRIGGLPESFKWIGGTRAWYVPFCIMLLVVGAFAVMLRHTTFGRKIYATGGNLEAARLSGIAVDAVRIRAYAICGMLAGFAGVMIASRTGVGDPTAGEGMELDAIAACVIGGASLMGGEGGALGVLGGAFIVNVLLNICRLEQVSDEWQRVVLGALIIGLVYCDNLRKKRAGTLRL